MKCSVDGIAHRELRMLLLGGFNAVKEVLLVRTKAADRSHCLLKLVCCLLFLSLGLRLAKGCWGLRLRI
ncbi:hypothetical protein D3C71_1627140 [compost metagenome]